jgi:hypothetical protein
MELIQTEAVTEYFAKRRAIDSATKYFRSNPEIFFVEIEVNWSDKLHDISGQDKVLARREIISQFYGIDFVVSSKRDLSKLAPNSKAQYMELWDALKRHEYSKGHIGRNRELSQEVRNLGSELKSKQDELNRKIRGKNSKG